MSRMRYSLFVAKRLRPEMTSIYSFFFVIVVVMVVEHTSFCFCRIKHVILLAHGYVPIKLTSTLDLSNIGEFSRS